MRDELDPDHWCNGGEYNYPHPDALAMQALDDENRELRAEIERLRAELRWISVDERLPEVGTKALTLWQNGIASVEWRLDTKNGWSTGAKVIFWMPFPPLPGEEAQA